MGSAVRILVNGCFGHHNLGDEAILAALTRRAAARGGVLLIPISRDPEDTTRRHGLEAIQRPRIAPLRPWRLDRLSHAWRLHRTLQGCNAAILGGGGVLVDLHRDDIANYLAPLAYAQRQGLPTAAFNVGGESLRRNASREGIRRVLGRASFVSARDRRTRELLIDCGLPPERVHLGADPALDLEAPSAGRGRSRALLVPCAYLGSVPAEEQQRREFWIAAASYLAGTGLEVDIVGFSPRDARWLETLGSVLPTQRTRVESRPLTSPEEYLERLQGCRLVVAEKLHGGVLAIAASVPALLLAYRIKVRAFGEEADLRDWTFDAGHGELERFRLPDEAAFRRAIDDILANPDAAATRVREAVQRLRARLDESYARLWSAVGENR